MTDTPSPTPPEPYSPYTDGERLQYVLDELARRPASEDAAIAFGELVGEIANRVLAGLTDPARDAVIDSDDHSESGAIDTADSTNKESNWSH